MVPLSNITREGYSPKVLGISRYVDQYDGNYLHLDQEFIEEYIEASKYTELTDELNDFIARFNRIQSTEVDNLPEAMLDSILYIDPNYTEGEVDLQMKMKTLKSFTLNLHFQSTNVFWIGELTEKDIYLHGDDTKSILVGQAVYYASREDDLSDEDENRALRPSSNFDPRLNTDPADKPFIWKPCGEWGFIYDEKQWKLFIPRI